MRKRSYDKDEAKLKLRDQILNFGFVPHGNIRPTVPPKMLLQRVIFPGGHDEDTLATMVANLNPRFFKSWRA